MGPKSDIAVKQMSQRLKLKLDEDQLTNCMRCGFCLPACPTYRETGVEAESPRGRIALMKAVADGMMTPDTRFEKQMNHCLGCRACEPACPADVKYGQLIEQAREAIEAHTTQHRWWVKIIRHIFFKGIFPYQNRMKILGGLLKIYQLSKLDLLIRKTGLLHLLPQHLREMEAILPAASAKGVVEKTGSFHPAQGERIGSVALFRGCLMDVLFTETNMNTVKLLNLSGFDVVIPETQACCGALHAHSGEAALAKELAKKNIKVFKQYQVDYIVSNAGGCGALLIEYDHLLQNEPDWQEDAKWFASRTIDISQLLYRHGRIEALRENFSNEQSDRLEEKNAKLGQASTSITITYQDSCHLRNGMRSSEAPQQLLKYTSGVHFVELYEADRCCGSAGIYNITQPEMAGQIIEQKMQHVNKTNAHYLVTSNPGCLLQMKHGIAKHGVDKQMEAVHIVDFLYNRITNQ